MQRVPSSSIATQGWASLGGLLTPNQIAATPNTTPSSSNLPSSTPPSQSSHTQSSNSGSGKANPEVPTSHNSVSAQYSHSSGGSSSSNPGNLNRQPQLGNSSNVSGGGSSGGNPSGSGHTSYITLRVGYTAFAPSGQDGSLLLAGTADARLCLLDLDRGTVASDFLASSSLTYDADEAVLCIAQSSSQPIATSPEMWWPDTCLPSHASHFGHHNSNHSHGRDGSTGFHSSSYHDASSAAGGHFGSGSSGIWSPSRGAQASGGGLGEGGGQEGVCVGGLGGDVLAGVASHTPSDWVAVGNRHGRVAVMDVRCGVAQLVWRAHELEVVSLATDGSSVLISASSDRCVCVCTKQREKER